MVHLQTLENKTRIEEITMLKFLHKTYTLFTHTYFWTILVITGIMLYACNREEPCTDDGCPSWHENQNQFGVDELTIPPDLEENIETINEIIEDKKIEIHDIKFNDVSILDILRKNPYQIKFTDQQKKEEVPNPLYLDNEICYNGAWRCDVSLPIYNWIIVKKFKQDIQPGISEFSDYSKLFHYSKEEKIIKEIKELLKL